MRCNSVHPAAVLTPMWEPMLGNGPEREANMAALVADTPLKRFGTVEEVAALALYLASDESAYMTGSELTLDGLSEAISSCWVMNSSTRNCRRSSSRARNASQSVTSAASTRSIP